MRKIKKATAILLTGIILSGTGVNTYAVTPQYRPPKTDFTIEDIVNAVEDYLKEHPIDIDISGTNLDKPQIEKAIFYHKKLYFNRARLQVCWDKLDKAKYYEVKVIKKNGDSKIYKTSDTSLFVYEKSDNFVTKCMRSGKVEVRAVNDNVKGDWSMAKTISCNSLH